MFELRMMFLTSSSLPKEKKRTKIQKVFFHASQWRCFNGRGLKSWCHIALIDRLCVHQSVCQTVSHFGPDSRIYSEFSSVPTRRRGGVKGLYRLAGRNMYSSLAPSTSAFTAER